jgi:hypothetical protein
MLLNIFPFVYHKHFVGVHSARAGDFFASENDPWNGDGGGGDDGGDDGDDGDDDNCTDPGSTTSDPSLINTYITNGQKWGTYEVTTTDNCSGESSSYTYDELIDDCSSPSDIDESVSDLHDYYLSGDAIYAKETHNISNSCNGSSTSYDEDVEDEEATREYQAWLASLPPPDSEIDYTDGNGTDGGTSKDTSATAYIANYAINQGYFVTFVWKRTSNVITAEQFDSGYLGVQIATDYKQSNYSYNVSGNVINFTVNGVATWFFLWKDLKIGKGFAVVSTGFFDISNGHKKVKTSFL